MIDIILQVFIFGLTGSGLWLAASDIYRRQRRGYLLCIFGQPLWIYDTWRHEQWGMLLLSFWLLCSFARGFWLRRR